MLQLRPSIAKQINQNGNTQSEEQQQRYKIQGWRVRERETINTKSKSTGVDVFVTQVRILEILLFFFPSFQQVGILGTKANGH